jgi:hypothetical protein
MTQFVAPGFGTQPDHFGPQGAVREGNRISVPGQLELLCQASPDGTSTGGYGIVRLTMHNAPPHMAAFHSTLTPEGLRHFASQCGAMAADLENTAALQAAEVISRAAGAGK